MRSDGLESSGQQKGRPDHSMFTHGTQRFSEGSVILLRQKDRMRGRHGFHVGMLDV